MVTLSARLKPCTLALYMQLWLRSHQFCHVPWPTKILSRVHSPFTEMRHPAYHHGKQFWNRDGCYRSSDPMFWRPWCSTHRFLLRVPKCGPQMDCLGVRAGWRPVCGYLFTLAFRSRLQVPHVSCQCRLNLTDRGSGTDTPVPTPTTLLSVRLLCVGPSGQSQLPSRSLILSQACPSITKSDIGFNQGNLTDPQLSGWVDTHVPVFQQIQVKDHAKLLGMIVGLGAADHR